MSDALTFGVGAPFSLSIPSLLVNKAGDVGNSGTTVQIKVANGVSFSLKTVSIQPSISSLLKEKCLKAQLVVYFWSDENPQKLPLCTFDLGEESILHRTVTGLGIEMAGERSVYLQAFLYGEAAQLQRETIPDLVCLFGSIEPSPWAADDIDFDGEAVVVTISKALEDHFDKSSHTKRRRKQSIDTPNDAEKNQKNVKSIIPQDGVITDKKELSETDEQDADRSSKKARKELALHKQKELQEVLAKENGFDTKSSDEKKKKKVEPKVKPLSTRRLTDGVVVQDIIIGAGTQAKKGRSVSINYVGTFPDSGDVFDKNQSRSNPLQFRLGTGQVIRGLDIGMDGMRAGGERIITIPPKMGYGQKKSGKIPGNSTLEFAVKFIQ
jgi:FKBP-type peptidyl-prolyl cis-trans isomerase